MPNPKDQKKSAHNETTKKSKKKQDLEDESEEEEEQEQKVTTKSKNKQSKQSKQIEESDDYEDEEEEEEEDIGDDDIYLPKKKIKISHDKEKPLKANQEKDKNKSGEDKDKSKEGKSQTEPKDEIEEYFEKVQKNKAERLSKKKKQGDNSQRGILYVGHLPYGFVEEGLKEYFGQYGEILNIHLARSKKTARSMGYAFIEFKYKDVAEAAAKAMDGYLIYGKKLICRVIKDDKGIRVKNKKFKFIPFSKMFLEQKNKPKKPQELRKEVKHLLKAEEKKREKLKELGIEYDFPGFKAALDEANKGDN